MTNHGKDTPGFRLGYDDIRKLRMSENTQSDKVTILTLQNEIERLREALHSIMDLRAYGDMHDPSGLRVTVEIAQDALKVQVWN